jgi:opacity protein-like surface antigen
MLAFLPTTSTQNDSYVFRPTAVAGAGINYKLTPHLSLRAEYRGLYFKGPDFRYMNGSIPVTSRYTLSSQPTLGLTYQFGKAAK